MGRSFRRRDRLEAMNQINITPLIDLCVALLIIFLISTPLLDTQTIPLNLPIETAKPQPFESEQKYQSITVDREGQYYWGPKAVSVTELEKLLQQLAVTPKPPILEIRGDARVDYQKIITVIDLIKGAGLSKISLDTSQTDPKR